MNPLALHETHHAHGATFTEITGSEAVLHYRDWHAEYLALHESAAVLDLSFRSRLCLTGADRVRFLHGQVTNDVKKLVPGQGCYAALVTAKGKMQSDLIIYSLPEELLLDFEPGLAAVVAERLEHYIIADDVQITDAAAAYGLLSVQGPQAATMVRQLALFAQIPETAASLASVNDAELGELYLTNQPRTGSAGFDLFAPTAALPALWERLLAAARPVGGCAAGWQALELARLEAGIPRYGADMDETNLPLEAGLENRAVSFAKGCYIGQEVIARIRTYGQVTKALRGLRLAEDLSTLPAKGAKLFATGKEAGYITSSAFSPALRANVALGYVRKECNQPGTELTWQAADGESRATIVALPFAR